MLPEGYTMQKLLCACVLILVCSSHAALGPTVGTPTVTVQDSSLNALASYGGSVFALYENSLVKFDETTMQEQARLNTSNPISFAYPLASKDSSNLFVFYYIGQNYCSYTRFDLATFEEKETVGVSQIGAYVSSFWDADGTTMYVNCGLNGFAEVNTTDGTVAPKLHYIQDTYSVPNSVQYSIQVWDGVEHYSGSSKLVYTFLWYGLFCKPGQCSSVFVLLDYESWKVVSAVNMYSYCQALNNSEGAVSNIVCLDTSGPSASIALSYYDPISLALQSSFLPTGTIYQNAYSFLISGEYALIGTSPFGNEGNPGVSTIMQVDLDAKKCVDELPLPNVVSGWAPSMPLMGVDSTGDGLYWTSIINKDGQLQLVLDTQFNSTVGSCLN